MNTRLRYEDWKPAQAEARARGWRLSNCYFLPAALRKKCDAGVMSLQWAENALFLLEDAGSFDRCYYFLSPTERPGMLKAEREVVVELPYAGALNEAQQRQVDALKAMGFLPARESGMMCCAPAELISHALLQTEQVTAACPDEIPAVLALFERCFDPRFAFLPTEEELRQAAEDGRALVVLLDGHVAAALHAGFEKTVASVRHVAVAEDFRGCGLGKVLMEAYHRRFAGRATMFQHWVDLHNTPAIALYQGFGYGFGLRKANEYIFTPDQSNTTER